MQGGISRSSLTLVILYVDVEFKDTVKCTLTVKTRFVCRIKDAKKESESLLVRLIDAPQNLRINFTTSGW